jgi:hypothetical protein
MTTEAQTVKQRRAPWSGALLSPRFFFVRAAALVIFFLLAHFAGLREYTTFLTGTTVNPEASRMVSALYGTTYLVLYMGFVVVAPILALAGGLLVIWERRSPNPKPNG